MPPRAAISRRADLTFRHNVRRGRHGWLRLTPAYSVKIIEGILNGLPEARGLRILDPFSGTATTPLCAAYRGHRGTSVDINPFLVWLGRTKARSYDREDLASYADAAASTCVALARHAVEPGPAPPIHDIERWWSKPALGFLCRLHAAVAAADCTDAARDLLRIVACRAVIARSNAAFDHPSMSFRASVDAPPGGDGRRPRAALGRWLRELARDLAEVGEGAADNPTGEAVVVHGDARTLEGLDRRRRFDVLITSPPYPNRMSYIRELRPYMYWLEYLREARAAGELDWEAIGGTWGVATSRLRDWSPDRDAFVPDYLPELLDAIEGAHPKNGVLMANYVRKYFEDVWRHLRAAARVLRRGAEVHYVVGNSTFYGHLVPVERLYVDLLEEAGFAAPRAEVIRKRNSNRRLFEFHVRATAPGSA